MKGLLVTIVIITVIAIIITILVIMIKPRNEKLASKRTSGANASDTHTPVHHAESDHGHSHEERSGLGPWSIVLISFVSVVLIILLYLLGSWAYGESKEFFKVDKGPRYAIVPVEVRRKTINLTSTFNNKDSIHMEYGQYCESWFASVPLCIKNGAGELTCGPAGSDPDLPSGSVNQDLWYKSNSDKKGKVVVVIFERRKQLIPR